MLASPPPHPPHFRAKPPQRLRAVLWRLLARLQRRRAALARTTPPCGQHWANHGEIIASAIYVITCAAFAFLLLPQHAKPGTETGILIFQVILIGLALAFLALGAQPAFRRQASFQGADSLEASAAHMEAKEAKALALHEAAEIEALVGHSKPGETRARL